jgi:hypothetical protein
MKGRKLLTLVCGFMNMGGGDMMNLSTGELIMSFD